MRTGKEMNVSKDTSVRQKLGVDEKEEGKGRKHFEIR